MRDRMGTTHLCVCYLLISELFFYFFQGKILPGGPKWNGSARHVQSNILQPFVEAPEP